MDTFLSKTAQNNEKNFLRLYKFITGKKTGVVVQSHPTELED